MDKKSTQRSKLRLLLNAEPFGFGPAAAISSFFPYLRYVFDVVGYVGKDHTLDLQSVLAYDAIHDISGLSTLEEKEALLHILPEYDIFFTAVDFEVGAWAKAAGARLCIYDPLTWYWKNLSPIVFESDLYLAQNFFGVEERIKRQNFPQARVVPPIVSERHHSRKRHHVLLNLGGLLNPFWATDDALLYARNIVAAAKKVLPEKSLIIATSSLLAEHLNDPFVKMYTRAEIRTILSETAYAFMTPGLGNIYDSAEFNVPTCWLPPANDSQGQQTVLLHAHEMSDGGIDWKDIFPNHSINYADEQLMVMSKIARMTRKLSGSIVAQDRLGNLFARERSRLEKIKTSGSRRLLEKFGSDGAYKVSEQIIDYARCVEEELFPS